MHGKKEHKNSEPKNRYATQSNFFKRRGDAASVTGHTPRVCATMWVRERVTCRQIKISAPGRRTGGLTKLSVEAGWHLKNQLISPNDPLPCHRGHILSNTFYLWPLQKKIQNFYQRVDSAALCQRTDSASILQKFPHSIYGSLYH